MGDSTKIKIGPAKIEFDGEDLGYTSGGVVAEYKRENFDVEVDQLNTKVDRIVTKEEFTVKVPLAELDLKRLFQFFNGASLNNVGDRYRLSLTGLAEGSLLPLAKTLVLTPKGGSPNDVLTMWHAIPDPEINLAYEKNKIRIFNVTFTAVPGKDANGKPQWVDIGDTTVPKI